VEHNEILSARQSGELTEAVLTPAESGNGWTLLLTTRSGRQTPYRGVGGRVPIFHDLDHATILARELGFEHIRVEERF
jgi:hypothetical protein